MSAKLTVCFSSGSGIRTKAAAEDRTAVGGQVHAFSDFLSWMTGANHELPALCGAGAFSRSR